jgi:hypothetical protein
MFTPITEKLTIYQGATFKKSWDVRVGGEIIDMSGWKGRAAMRYEYDDTSPVWLCTTEDGGVVLDVENSRVTLYITPAKTEAVIADGFWDLELEDAAGDVGRLLMGKVKVSREVTKYEPVV